MAVLQMQRISICALKRDRKAILENLQSMGVIEMNQIVDEDDGFEKMDTQNARVGFEKKAQLSENALAILESYAPQKQSLLSSLEGKALIGQKKFDSTVAAKETITAKANTLVALNKEIAENKANILKLSNQIESLSPWLNLDVPMNYTGTDKVAMLLGTMAADTAQDAVYAKIATHAQTTDAVDVEIIRTDKDVTYLVVFCLREDETAVEEALRAAGFARPSQVVDKKPDRKSVV